MPRPTNGSRICEKLEEQGVTTFRDDRDIAGGDDIPDAIRHKVKESAELLVLLTPQSVNRPWILLEIGAGWAHEKRITVVRYHVEIEVIPDILKSSKSITLNDVDVYFSEVGDRAKDKGIE